MKTLLSESQQKKLDERRELKRKARNKRKARGEKGCQTPVGVA